MAISSLTLYSLLLRLVLDISDVLLKSLYKSSFTDYTLCILLPLLLGFSNVILLFSLYINMVSDFFSIIFNASACSLVTGE